MIVSTSRPYFAPFPGFFYLANFCDIFVILDTVRFPRGSTWITRNRFKNDQGTLWLTIPVLPYIWLQLPPASILMPIFLKRPASSCIMLKSHPVSIRNCGAILSPIFRHLISCLIAAPKRGRYYSPPNYCGNWRIEPFINYMEGELVIRLLSIAKMFVL